MNSSQHFDKVLAESWGSTASGRGAGILPHYRGRLLATRPVSQLSGMTLPPRVSFVFLPASPIPQNATMEGPAAVSLGSSLPLG